MDYLNRSVILVNPPVSEKPWPPFLQIMIKGLEADQYGAWPIEHLGLMSIKAAAKATGIQIHVIDGIVEQHFCTDDTWNAIVQLSELEGNPIVIGFSSMIAFMQNVEIATRAKQKWPDVVTVFGQDFATLNWRRILESYSVVDIVSIGDGESVFPEIVKRISSNQDYRGVPGTAWLDRDSGEVKSIAGVAVALDDLPWPDRSSHLKLKPLGFSPAVFSSRGCPFRCKFCTTGAISAGMRSDGYRLKSVENLVNEIEHLYRQYGAKFITIVDDLFVAPGTGSRSRAAEFARELIKREIRIGFMFDTRVDAIDRDLFLLLREAGLKRVVIGIETADVEQLAMLGKEYSKTRSIQEKLAVLVDLDIEIIPGIVAFHPRVKPEELRQTLELLDVIKYKNLSVLLNRVVAYPGTPLYQEYKDNGLLTDDWPVGQWNFKDPLAEEMYQRIAKGIKNSDYIIARQNVVDCLDDWQKRTRQINAVLV